MIDEIKLLLSQNKYEILEFNKKVNIHSISDYKFTRYYPYCKLSKKFCENELYEILKNLNKDNILISFHKFINLINANPRIKDSTYNFITNYYLNDNDISQKTAITTPNPIPLKSTEINIKEFFDLNHKFPIIIEPWLSNDYFVFIYENGVNNLYINNEFYYDCIFVNFEDYIEGDCVLFGYIHEHSYYISEALNINDWKSLNSNRFYTRKLKKKFDWSIHIKNAPLFVIKNFEELYIFLNLCSNWNVKRAVIKNFDIESKMHLYQHTIDLSIKTKFKVMFIAEKNYCVIKLTGTEKRTLYIKIPDHIKYNKEKYVIIQHLYNDFANLLIEAKLVEFTNDPSGLS